MFLFNLLSDLHLELTWNAHGYKSFQFPATAPNLILAGDIGKTVDSGYNSFIRRACAAYKDVYLVLGNHCAYGTTWSDAVERGRKLAAEIPNLHFLHRDAYKVPGHKLTILGTTLHSHIPEKAKKEVTECINDFYYIKKWTVETHNDEHTKSIQWLNDETKNAAPDMQLVGLFHYPPINKGVSDPVFELADNRSLNSAFSTDLSSSSWLKRLSHVMFGHTHYCSDQVVDSTRIFSNQRGYNGEVDHRFSANRVYAIDTEES